VPVKGPIIVAILGGLSAIAPLGHGSAMVPRDRSLTIAQTSDIDNAEPIISSPSPAPYLRPPSTCPAAVETLMAGLVRDVPSYANRVASRQLGVNEAEFGTVLVAGRAEFEPLDISDRLFDSGRYDPDTIQQVFFTTLERQYTETEQVQVQQFHWLFLTQADDGWRLVLMFSRLGVVGDELRPPTPPEESSNGVIGQAVRLWLRDCRAGALYPIEAPEEATPEAAAGIAR
jgi:hypothetical protein